ncbi:MULTISPECIES: hypothetical protein [unclassified Amycolatopsis]|nr:MULTISPECIES: hypothetical protein [unclassified Amycolatopsis]WSJ81650.1 DUF2945 domain-containing protein [Amycolatopsis sp. NBC_01307]WSK74974.1 DUF2945 domain-containing protein [Amycolatopsis sp. NBC_01286]
MAHDFKKGDRVRWDAGNESSTDAPQFLVRSEKTGRTAVHRPDAVHPA